MSCLVLQRNQLQIFRVWLASIPGNNKRKGKHKQNRKQEKFDSEILNWKEKISTPASILLLIVSLVWRSILSFHQQIPSATKSEPKKTVRKESMVIAMF